MREIARLGGEIFGLADIQSGEGKRPYGALSHLEEVHFVECRFGKGYKNSAGPPTYVQENGPPEISVRKLSL